MSRFKALDEFEKRFPTMTVKELRSWLVYWKQHAELLQPKVRKLTMKRVHRIQRAIELKERDQV